jgi:hypothetical protein
MVLTPPPALVVERVTAYAWVAVSPLGAVSLGVVVVVVGVVVVVVVVVVAGEVTVVLVPPIPPVAVAALLE